MSSHVVGFFKAKPLHVMFEYFHVKFHLYISQKLTVLIFIVYLR